MSLSTICLHQKHIWGLGPMLLELRSFFIRPDNPIHENKTSHFCLLWAATLNHRTRLTCNALNSQTSTATLRYIYVPLLIWMRCNLYWVLVKKKKTPQEVRICKFSNYSQRDRAFYTERLPLNTKLHSLEEIGFACLCWELHSLNMHKKAVSLYRRMSKCDTKCVKEHGLVTINWYCLYTFSAGEEERTLNMSLCSSCRISRVWCDVVPPREMFDRYAHMENQHSKGAKLQSDMMRREEIFVADCKTWQRSDFGMIKTNIDRDKTQNWGETPTWGQSHWMALKRITSVSMGMMLGHIYSMTGLCVFQWWHVCVGV